MRDEEICVNSDGDLHVNVVMKLISTLDLYSPRLFSYYYYLLSLSLSAVRPDRRKPWENSQGWALLPSCSSIVLP